MNQKLLQLITRKSKYLSADYKHTDLACPLEDVVDLENLIENGKINIMISVSAVNFVWVFVPFIIIMIVNIR